MQLISINTAEATAYEGVLTLNVSYTDDGGATQTVDYGWQVGDPYGLGPQLDAYLTAHPGFPITPYVPPAPTGAMVDAERERRRYLPIDVTISDETFGINMDATSQANIQGLSTVGLYLSSAAPTQTTPFRDLANTMHDLLPADMVSMGMQVAAHIQALYVASWAIKALDPIPADYADDSHWT